MYKILCVAAVLLAAIVIVRYPAKAGPSGTSKGVTLIVLGCGQDPNNTVVFGPGDIGVSAGFCDGYGQINAPQLPSGTLYNLRAAVGLGTTDPTPVNSEVRLVTYPHRQAELVCQVTSKNGICQDLTHTINVNAGDTVHATVSIPDSSSWISTVTITFEENIVE
jgi:hypothetical protein